MSKLCLILIDNIVSNEREDIIKHAAEKAHSCGVGIVSNLKFLDEKYQDIIKCFNNTEAVYFSISDKEGIDTCEDFLCPDWCNVHEKRDRPFVENLKILQKIVSANFRYHNDIHIFVGMDLGLYNDYFEIHCQLDNLVQTIQLLTEKEGYVPDLHIIVKE